MPFHFWLSRIADGATYMDALHHDVAKALLRLPAIKDDEFQDGYDVLLRKLERIFRAEERWMEEIRFPELKHHREQHVSILHTLYHGRSQLTDGNTQFGRNIIENLLPEWLHFHASTMDSALARELRVAALT
jgi:hemerythrin-like metal-binding protein